MSRNYSCKITKC